MKTLTFALLLISTIANGAGGHYVGAPSGSSHKGGHYVNSATGNHYGHPHNPPKPKHKARS